MGYIPILLFCFFSLLNRVTATAIDIINTTQFIRDGDTIVSADGTYELGFFSPGKSKNRYLGIWYGKIPVQTVVWVANRETPLDDSLGVLKITHKGILILLDRSGSVIWSSNTARPARNPTAQLLESGNLVVKEEGDNNLENSLWQSFEHPTDTILPGMKLGRSRITGMDWSMTSWKSEDDPSRGNITCKLAPYGYPDMVVMEGSEVKYRSGLWDGLRFSGVPSTKPNPIYKYEFVFNEKEIFYRESLVDKSMHWRLVTRQNGDVASFAWIEKKQSWFLYETANTDNCDRYALCGANGFCDIQSSPVCDCLNGFVPKSPRDWDATDWANGCVRRTPLNCAGDGFRKLAGVKMPETKSSWFSKTMNLEECRNTCLEKCNCTAYSNLDIRNGGSGCLLWFGDLVDIRVLDDNEQEIYIRMAVSELDNGDGAKINKKSKAKKRIIISTVLSTGILFLGLALVLSVWMKKQQKNRKIADALERSADHMHKEDLELPLFDLGTLACATNNFSVENKLGEGGFGSVYKGTLEDRREIAVKRLSKNSRQGLDEFKNEANYIVKLQHQNLVKLLGCCIQGDEKILIYEFLPNRSLDIFIFADQSWNDLTWENNLTENTHSFLLDWPKRCNIIFGIARGLLYLHQDSRLRVIHRDLKASNILLDDELNPKISDFGLARSFGGNETEANTNKVAGTYGYISPEYANHGLYSLKSDVFSFGVLVLEIVSGNRNRGFIHPDHSLNLLGHAWRLFEENRPLELVAESLVIACNLSEVLRSIHVGLLCVQENPEDRPNMSNVVLMLRDDDTLPQPKQPGFFTERDPTEARYSSSLSKPCSVNECSISELRPR
ncbi:G-type lectin S-receptor-like serine/threonine-protein kinase At4g27290 isoform X2 [Populus nigra]|uniref:G-type lectin S-receptor-like serine/threonine-protein kinase At4g27290 isoform X2 n=1 Tax=Populus nigra TaxID=3691 RepID=UPI002B270221|nr:G-type lectin S-receptor-like serine/threonine-protein kinase At4g27290 isoform X2 [Populus nigra]